MSLTSYRAAPPRVKTYQTVRPGLRFWRLKLVAEVGVALTIGPCDPGVMSPSSVLTACPRENGAVAERPSDFHLNGGVLGFTPKQHWSASLVSHQGPPPCHRGALLLSYARLSLVRTVGIAPTTFSV